MPNKQYYVLKDAKTEPPVDIMDSRDAPRYFTLPSGSHAFYSNGEFKISRYVSAGYVSHYLTPCTEPLFTMEEVERAWEKWQLKDARGYNKGTKRYEYAKKQFLEQLKQSK